MRVEYMSGLNWGRGRRSIWPNSTSHSSGSYAYGSGSPACRRGRGRGCTGWQAGGWPMRLAPHLISWRITTGSGALDRTV